MFDDFNFYDSEKIKKQKESLALKQIKLMRKLKNGDEKAREELLKLMDKQDKLEKKAEDAGFDWI